MYNRNVLLHHLNTCVKEVRLRSLSCQLYNQNVRERVGARPGYYRTVERPVGRRGCQDPSEPLLISAELRYMVCSIYTYIHTRLPIICWPPSAHIKELYVIADEQFQAVSKTCQEVTNIL